MEALDSKCTIAMNYDEQLPITGFEIVGIIELKKDDERGEAQDIVRTNENEEPEGWAVYANTSATELPQTWIADFDDKETAKYFVNVLEGIAHSSRIGYAKIPAARTKIEFDTLHIQHSAQNENYYLSNDQIHEVQQNAGIITIEPEGVTEDLIVALIKSIGNPCAEDTIIHN